jgi:hypothetical protein
MCFLISSPSGNIAWKQLCFNKNVSISFARSPMDFRPKNRAIHNLKTFFLGKMAFMANSPQHYEQ